MSEFVNFNKRDISLPVGCKDLFDLLRLDERTKIPNSSRRPTAGKFQDWFRKLLETSNQTAELLSETGNYIDMIVCSTASVAYLTISSSGKQLILHFYKYNLFGVTGILAVVEVKLKTPEHKALREFLHRHCFEPLDAKPAGLISPNFPRELRRIEPLPADRDALIRLFVNLFHETCGLADADEVEVNFREATYPPKAHN